IGKAGAPERKGGAQVVDERGSVHQRAGLLDEACALSRARLPEPMTKGHGNGAVGFLSAKGEGLHHALGESVVAEMTVDEHQTGNPLRKKPRKLESEQCAEAIADEANRVAAEGRVEERRKVEHH